MTSSSTPRCRGIFPVVPTTFADTGELDLASQKRAVDFMIDAGSDGSSLASFKIMSAPEKWLLLFLRKHHRKRFFSLD